MVARATLKSTPPRALRKRRKCSLGGRMVAQTSFGSILYKEFIKKSTRPGALAKRRKCSLGGRMVTRTSEVQYAIN